MEAPARTTARERGRRFRALHDRPEPFIIPNPWDAGSARLLAGAGFEALATTSAGLAASLGRVDGTIDAEATLGNVAAIVAATDLPVTADLEHGYGETPEAVARIIAEAGEVGAVGGSIEDLAGRDGGLLDLGLAVERVRAAAEAARSLPVDFVVTARSEGLGTGLADLATTIERLQAFQEAGADVLYAPGLTAPDDIRLVVSSVDRPVNVVMGLAGPTLGLDELGRLGVRRVSVGSALARAAYGALLRAVDELSGTGTFDFAAEAVPYPVLNRLLSAPSTSPDAR